MRIRSYALIECMLVYLNDTHACLLAHMSESIVACSLHVIHSLLNEIIVACALHVIHSLLNEIIVACALHVIHCL